MRDGFVFYRSFLECLQELPDADRLALYDTIAHYGISGEEIETNGLSKAIFALIKPVIDANTTRYENGKKGGRPKTETKPKGNRNKTESKPKEEKEKEKDKEVDVEKDIYISSPSSAERDDAWFESFWSEYPRKVGKGKCRDKFRKIVTSEKKFNELMEGLREQNKVFCMKEIKYIPLPETWLNQGRWEDTLQADNERPAEKEIDWSVYRDWPAET